MIRMLVVSVLLLALGLSSALAGDEITASRISSTEIESLQDSREDCMVGNPNVRGWAIETYLETPQTYNYLFNTPDDCGCPLGYEISSVTSYLFFREDDIPAAIVMAVDLREANWDENLLCFVPGNEICVSEPVTFEVTIDDFQFGLPAQYRFDLPVTCGCVAKEFEYFLSVRYLNEIPGDDPGLVLDAVPLACTSYRSSISGWEDLFEVGFNNWGSLWIRAEADCCEFPVGNQDATWGKLKSIFR